MFRIVINFGTIRAARANEERIAGMVATLEDQVSRGGHLLQVMTNDPARFITDYFDEGFVDTFTCQTEGL